MCLVRLCVVLVSYWRQLSKSAEDQEMCWPLFLEWAWCSTMFVSFVVCVWDRALVSDSSCIAFMWSYAILLWLLAVGLLEKTLARVVHHKPVNKCGCVHVCHALRTETSCLLRYSLQLHSHTIEQPLKTVFNGFPVHWNKMLRLKVLFYWSNSY